MMTVMMTWVTDGNDSDGGSNAEVIAVVAAAVMTKVVKMVCWR